MGRIIYGLEDGGGLWIRHSLLHKVNMFETSFQVMISIKQLISEHRHQTKGKAEMHIC